MIERVIARQLSNGLWQWRLQSDGGWNGNDYHTGDNEALAAALPASTTPVLMVLPGAEVVSTELTIDGKEKRHFAKLLPFEMEEQLVESVDNLHFSFAFFSENKASVSYLRADSLKDSLSPLLDVACDVQQCLPDYLHLKRDASDATLLLDDGLVLAHFGAGKGFSIEEDIAPLLLADLKDSFFDDVSEHSQGLNLVAEDAEGISRLRSWLPEEWLDEDGPEIRDYEGDFWQWLEVDSQYSGLNLRSGQFSRQLPVGRWWKSWKIPFAFAAVAFIVSILVMFGQYSIAKNEGRQIREQIEAVYLQAVPNGRKSDFEKRLTDLLRNSSSKGAEPTNVMPLLSGFAAAMAEQKDVTLASFRYSGDQKELQVNIEVKGLGELGQFRELLGTKGFESGSPRTSRQGDKYQARMKITEKGL